MKLRITPNKFISDLQKDFNTLFPFLKLEFYYNKVYQQPDQSPNLMVPAAQRIGRAQLSLTDGYIDLYPSMSVRDLEAKLRTEFSLNAQVFRRSGNVWLQTTMTDAWTLKRQNEHGKEITETTQKREEVDYDLSRDE